jgi:hypothetical protein
MAAHGQDPDRAGEGTAHCWVSSSPRPIAGGVPASAPAPWIGPNDVLGGKRKSSFHHGQSGICVLRKVHLRLSRLACTRSLAHITFLFFARSGERAVPRRHRRLLAGVPGRHHEAGTGAGGPIPRGGDLEVGGQVPEGRHERARPVERARRPGGPGQGVPGLAGREPEGPRADGPAATAPGRPEEGGDCIVSVLRDDEQQGGERRVDIGCGDVDAFAMDDQFGARCIVVRWF